MELISLEPNQHLVTFVPKLTAELPFFNLTTYQKNLPSVIKFAGVDAEGHPINWEVYQNTNKEIGPPRADAHRVWYQLVKPAADAARRVDGTIPEIIPLGKIRQCLRIIGWSAGGHQERKLIRCLNQIGAAWCVADLWIPTKSTDELGRPKYIQVKGRFSRLSVYAIGEHHLTEEELLNVNFDFDLDDILYIKLDPLEARMQEAPDQRLYDNTYWFSVDPAARRWYELLAPKVFGTVKNGAEYFEVKYSWYVAHHHTLKRFYERYRVVEQMKRLVRDHLESGYLKRVEYRALKIPDQEIDYIIRYYPGSGAMESNARIQTFIREGRDRRKSRGLPKRPIVPTRDIPSSLALCNTTADHVELISKLIFDFRIHPLKAVALTVERTNAVRRQIEAWRFRNTQPRNLAGWMIQAIEKNYDLPDSFVNHQQAEAGKRTQEATQRAIAECLLCDAQGFRQVKGENSFHGVMRQCTHDSRVETQIAPDAQKRTESADNASDDKDDLTYEFEP